MRLRSRRSSRSAGIALIALQIYCVAGFAQTQTKNLTPKQTPPSNISQQKLDGLKNLGDAYLQKKDWRSASTTFDEALAIRPDDPKSLYGEALALFNLRQIVAADEKLEKAIQILSASPDEKKLLVDCLVLSAVISAVQNKNSAAIEKLERAVKILPTDFDANLSLGRAYFGNGNVAASITAFRRALAILPGHVQARFFLATALEHDGNYTDALKEYREILRLDPNNAEGNLGLGVLLLKVEGDNSAEGVAALRRAVALNQGLYEGQITLGRTLVRQNKAAEAIGHLQKAAELAPNNPEPHFQLAIAYRKLGNREKADAETEMVKKIHESRRGVSTQTPK